MKDALRMEINEILQIYNEGGKPPSFVSNVDLNLSDTQMARLLSMHNGNLGGHKLTYSILSIEMR